MPWLIHLNGPAGVGKSTLARRYAEEHPGSLNLEADTVVSLIGGWERDEAERFEDAARSADSAYVEVAMVATVEEQNTRFRGRSQNDQVKRHIARAVDAMGGDNLLRKINGDFTRYLSHRPRALRLETSDVPSPVAYRRLLSLLTTG